MELELLILEQQVDALNKVPFESLSVLSLEEAGLEEDTRREPVFGHTQQREWSACGGVGEVVSWFSDGEDSRWEVN